MKPYFKDGPFTVYFGDSEKVVPQLNQKIDAIVTDPPYGIGFKGGTGGSYLFPGRKINGDDKPFDPSWMLKMKVERLCLWGANNYAGKLPNAYGWLIWDKRSPKSSNDQSDAELAWTTKGGTVRIKRLYWAGGAKQVESAERRIHPTQKPVLLLAWCLDQMKVTKGMTVLDPYMGSASLGVACMLKGMNYIGVENDKEFIDSAVKRLKHRLAKFKNGFGLI